MSEYVIELKNVTKRFPGVVALRDMKIQVKPGEIHGLVGENGAGKSTLIKVMTGVHQADEGEIYVDGQKVSFASPKESSEAGVACVYQELNIDRLMNVTDNVFMNKWIKGSSGLLDYAEMDRRTKEVLTEIGQDLDPNEIAGKLGMGQQQMIEIAKAILIDSKVIIMDEPSSSLGEKEVEQLFKVCRRLKEQGIAIIYVSHKLEELFELCDCVTVMRDGEYIWTKPIEEVTNDSLVSAMVGRSLDNQFPKEFGERGRCALKIENLSQVGRVDDVSFEAYEGEILGFSGLVGAGRTETMLALFGSDPIDGGKVYVYDEEVNFKSPREAIEKGLALLTEDRKGQGLVLGQSVKSNLILSSLREFTEGGLFLQEDKIEKTCHENVDALKIKTPTIEETTAKLSGGNQQKVVIGKWLNTDADIYIFDEPTRGIDVGAKVEVYNIMNNLVKQGKCVIMVSSEMPEILGMSDRVVVMREGRITATIERDSKHFNQESIMQAAWGGSLDD